MIRILVLALAACVGGHTSTDSCAVVALVAADTLTASARFDCDLTGVNVYMSALSAVMADESAEWWISGELFGHYEGPTRCGSAVSVTWLLPEPRPERVVATAGLWTDSGGRLPECHVQVQP